MKKILKWIGIALGAIVILLIIAVGVLYVRGSAKFNQTYAVQVENVSIPNDPEAVARGKVWVESLCAGCHGENLAGTSFFDDPSLGAFNAKNLTRGKGGIGATYTDADWVRTLRHGVRPGGTSVFVMPANAFYYLNDKDLGDIVAYVKSVPPVDQEWKPPQLTPFALILTGAGVFDSNFVAGLIDHTAPRPAAPAVGVSKEYGDYLVRVYDCRTCHGQALAGGRLPDPTITDVAPNLTPGGELAAWSEADFFKTIRTGTTPSGHVLNENMPWKEYARLTDDELKAVFMYLQSLPKLPTAAGR